MARLELYSRRDGIVQKQSGLNWGFSNGNVCIDDACIAITNSFIINNPGFFPLAERTINVLWDDNTEMSCSIEGTQIINETTYPKQLTSASDKSVIGVYLRRRMGIPSGQEIVMADLDNYGRRDVEIISIGNNKYTIDFSV
ncbi:restriction endonuclease PLD domain-containing protein [Lacrimispora sp.]|uniref:restriction endonuclease PLD domain-containing protein n=1 Tax=Lacrimispora sp. TaxID=2719234 RepID=UPI0028AB27D6|nr:restriction endonuclease PLD domain-containing protein [Lacrimispora sp.]